MYTILGAIDPAKYLTQTLLANLIGDSEFDATTNTTRIAP